MKIIVMVPRTIRVCDECEYELPYNGEIDYLKGKEYHMKCGQKVREKESK